VDRWLAYTRRYEGCERSFYRCVANKVTIGDGCIAEPIALAFKMPLRRLDDGQLASREEIRAEWEKIKNVPDLDKQGARAARKLATLFLPPEAIEALTWERFRATASDLARRFPGFPTWPAAAQLATMGMAWALGTEKLQRLFVRWGRAVAAKDWGGAAAECKILEDGNAGVIGRNLANRGLFLFAAEGDPEELPSWVGKSEPPGPSAPEPTLPAPTVEIDEGRVRELVVQTSEGMARELLAEGYRRR
jgi:GH24 family phage-related lysozyme (muramidase)